MSRKTQIKLRIETRTLPNHRQLCEQLALAKNLIKQIGRRSTNQYIDNCRYSLKQCIQDIRKRIKNNNGFAERIYHVETKRQGRVIQEYSFSGVADAYRKLKENIKEFRADRRRVETFTERVYISRSRALNRVTTGGVHTEPNFYIKALRYKRTENLSDSKSPKNSDTHVSIELEFFTKVSETDLSFMFIDSGISQYVQLKGDGSISPPYGSNGFEIAVCMPRVLLVDILQKVCSVLKAAEAGVNKTCGYHVHLDMRNKTREEMEKIFSNLVSSQKVMQKMLPPSRSKGSHAKRYCRPNTRKDYQNNLDSRYKSINALSYQRYRTLEVRMHSGTVDYDKILNFILILEHICELPEVVKRATNKVESFSRRFKLPMFLQNYIQERVNKFATSHVDNNLTTEDVG